MVEQIQDWASQRGYRVAWGPAEVVATVLREVAARRDSGEIDEGLYGNELAALNGGGFPRDSGLTTVVVIVKPRPAHTVTFKLGETQIQAVLPPTYVRYQPLFDDVRRDLQEHGLPGARVERVGAPLKLLAASLGLVRYGLNNVTYAPGIGSYLQLFGYLTDAALPLPDGWRPKAPTLLQECETCGACLSNCPTGAIAEDRVLLHAERCLTFINENPGSIPAWVPTWAHNGLIGCLLCQRSCPVNPPLPLECTGVSFTGEETQALMGDTGERSGPVWDGVRAKLKELGQPSSEPVLGRNLRALVEASSVQH